MFFFFQAEDGIRDGRVTGVQTCALPISYGGYYYVNFFNSNDKYLNFANIDNALLVTGTAAAPVCISGPPCVPYNIFRDAGVTNQQLQYLYIAGTGAGSYTMRTMHAEVTGDLSHYGVTVPTAHDGIGINLGWDRKSTRL